MTVRSKRRDCQRAHSIGAEIEFPEVARQSKKFGLFPRYEAKPFSCFLSRSNDVVIRVYDDAGNVIETHEHKGHFKAW
jgi:hypothetical protein